MTLKEQLTGALPFERLSAKDALALLETAADGLSAEEAGIRQRDFGPNAFAEGKKKSLFAMFLSQLNDPMIYILFAATAVSILLKEFTDAYIIIAIILINAFVGLVQENKAEKSLEALKQLSSPYAAVRRGGRLREIPAAELVPGDVILLEAGRIVPADVRLLESINLKIEESALTGESVPVEKDAGFVAEGDAAAGIGDRINMGYLSTGVAYGRGLAVVTATGMDTEMGRIARMLAGEGGKLTPLQKKLAGLGKALGILALLICAALFAVAILQGRDLMEMLLTAISLAVAAIPEGLPAVVTIVLALGVQRMVKVNTIVRKLPAVETLGSVSVVCSDKTGTLTQNKMAVTTLYTFEDDALWSVGDFRYEGTRKLLIDGFVLCTDAEVGGDGARIGDPTELALLDLGAAKDIRKRDLEHAMPRVGELAFDSDRKMMTTAHRLDDGGAVAFTKGAVDNLLEHCVDGDGKPLGGEAKRRVMDASAEMAGDALRVLGLAYKTGDDTATEDGLTFLGLVGMIDPPRPEAAGAVEDFKAASITTVMITGDHRDTAFAIAKEIGIADSPGQVISGDELNKMSQEELSEAVPRLRVFARVSPEHKVMIVKAFQSHGHIVSMTGDGVNDAPSLKAADIGVAMGITGTDVSKGAADMVLADDNFATIRLAVREGRNIYSNIRETVLFLLSSNLGEIVTMFFAIAIGLLSPLRAIHILWINLITDSLPALALGVDPPEDDIMKYPPRDAKAGLFADGGMFATVLFGAVIGAVTLVAYLYEPVSILRAGGESVSIAAIDAVLRDPVAYSRAQTFAFTTLGISQLFNAIGFKKLHKSLFSVNHLQNRMMIFAFCFGVGLQVAVTEVPVLSGLFETSRLSLAEWLCLIALCTVPLWAHEIYSLIYNVYTGGKSKQTLVRPGVSHER
ncbi:MAG: cation-translocating P-type ATPase [Clostridiales Family XIII bacterium]|jgi:Ca2+-transporting ATPase|nr:cation-translocating P-type ATPase [Clostridiales Family XIII bacterium]